MTCRHCKFCKIIKTLSGRKYHCTKDKKASYKEVGCTKFESKFYAWR